MTTAADPDTSARFPHIATLKRRLEIEGKDVPVESIRSRGARRARHGGRVRGPWLAKPARCSWKARRERARAGTPLRRSITVPRIAQVVLAPHGSGAARRCDRGEGARPTGSYRRRPCWKQASNWRTRSNESSDWKRSSRGMTGEVRAQTEAPCAGSGKAGVRRIPTSARPGQDRRVARQRAAGTGARGTSRLARRADLDLPGDPPHVGSGVG